MIDLVVDLREGGHHSGNWGGLLANPGIILAHALACITDARGTIAVPKWRTQLEQRPETWSNDLKRASPSAPLDQPRAFMGA